MIARSFVKWSKQLLLHSSSPQDELIIRILIRIPNAESPELPEEDF
jgi:hypothetical protein